MKHFHLLSFVLGIASGFLVLFLFLGGMRLIRPARPGFLMNSGTSQQRGRTPSTVLRAGGGPNLTRMAERLGMAEAELQAALESGKTLQDIAQEKGITLPAGRGPRGSNATTSSGSTASGASAQATSSVSQ